VALSRKFPGSWALYVYADDDARYELLQTVRAGVLFMFRLIRL
jgi:hypothetical protein